MQFNSQIGQDKWVCQMLENKRNGYFIDIGACDGVTISNTYVLEKELGWTGICVEPARKPFAKLKAARNCICVNKAAYSTDGVVSFMEYPDDQYRGNITNIKAMDSGIRTVIESITLDSLIYEYNSPRVIDYISIDVEGLEYEILTGFPFEYYFSLCWTIEHNDVEPFTKRNKVRELMALHGYTLYPEHLRKEGWFEDWFYYGE